MPENRTPSERARLAAETVAEIAKKLRGRFVAAEALEKIAEHLERLAADLEASHER